MGVGSDLIVATDGEYVGPLGRLPVGTCPSSVLAAVVLVFLVAPTDILAVEDRADCRQTPTAACVAAMARDALADIDADRDWVSGAAEVATAFFTIGETALARGLLQDARLRASALDDAGARAAALTDLAAALVMDGNADGLGDLLGAALQSAEAIEDRQKRWDTTGKLAVIYAEAGDISTGLAIAAGMPQADATLAAFKARTLHDIAPLQARAGGLEDALDTLASIDMGITYYQATVRTGVATIVTRNHPLVAANLLGEADTIARAQQDGYFVAGALRHVGAAYATMNMEHKSMVYFTAAAEGARRVESAQKKARAISRVATALADFRRFAEAAALIPEAVGVAATETADDMRLWAMYEISGAAAFAGEFEVALELLDAIPSSFEFFGKPLHAAAERDVAWGLARHARVQAAVAMAAGITAPRERVQALSRIARVLEVPDMRALPRYL